MAANRERTTAPMVTTAAGATSRRRASNSYLERRCSEMSCCGGGHVHAAGHVHTPAAHAEHEHAKENNRSLLFPGLLILGLIAVAIYAFVN